MAATAKEKLSGRAVSPKQMYEIADQVLQWFTGELREVFKKRWLQLKNVPWTDTPLNGKALMNSGIGKSAIQELTAAASAANNGTVEDGGRAEINLIASGQVGTWNISLLTAVLLNMKAKNESEAITRKVNVALTVMRNVDKIVYQRPKMTMEAEEYETITIKLKNAIILLNIDEGRLASVIAKYLDSVITVEDVMQIGECMETGTVYLNAGDSNKAVEYYTRALQFSSQITPELKMEIYRLRLAANFLGGYHDKQQKYATFRDALEINKLGGNYNKAHGVLQVNYILKDIPYQAIHYFNKWQGTKIFNCFIGIQHTVKEIASLHKEATGYKLLIKGCNLCETVCQIVLNNGDTDWRKLVDALDCFKRASGKTVSIGKFAYSAALVIFFNKRNKFSNFEEDNIDDAVKILRDFASERNTFPHIFGDNLTKTESDRVGFAQFLLGLLYETGQNVEMNFVAAEKWYQKAAVKYNMPTAAFNLALMYFNGVTGVQKNREMAKFYLQQAVAYAHPLAVSSLAVLYINELNIVSARCLIKFNLMVNSKVKAKLNNNHPVLDEFREWFLRRFVLYTIVGWDYKINFLENIISKEYETPHRLSRKGLTFLERIKRAELLGFEHNVKDLLEATENIFKLTPPVENPEVCPNFEEELDQDGLSEFAKGIIRLKKEFAKINEIVMWSKEELSREMVFYICNTLYDCLEASPSIKLGLQLCSYFHSHVLRKITEIVKALLTELMVTQTTYVLDEALCELKMKAGLVYISFTPELSKGATDFQAVRDFLNEINKHARYFFNEYPDCNLYKIWLAEFENKDIGMIIKETADVLKKAVLSTEDNLAFLYFSGDWHFQMYSKGLEEYDRNLPDGRQMSFIVDPVLGAKQAVTDYRKFLEKAPFEHPFYPKASYSLAWAYIRAIGMAKSTKDSAMKLRQILDEEDSSETANNQPMSQKEKLEVIMKAYAAGVNAEKLQLSCFPVTLAASHLRERIEIYIERAQQGLIGQIVKCIEENDFTSLKKENWRKLFSKTYLVSPLRIFFTTNLRYRLKTLRENPPVRKSSASQQFVYKVQGLVRFMKEFPPTSAVLSSPDGPKDVRTVDNGIIPFGSLDDVHGYQFPLTVIDELVFEASFAYFLTEDEEGNIIHVGVDYGSTIYKGKPYLNLEFGTRIIIIFPSYRILDNGDDRWLHVKKTGRCKIILTGRIDNMCRFCGNAKSTKGCSKCKRMYCSEQCQKKDFKVMKHKYICESD